MLTKSGFANKVKVAYLVDKNSIPIFISSANNSEPSDNSPLLIKASFTLFKYDDIFFCYILVINKTVSHSTCVVVLT